MKFIYNMSFCSAVLLLSSCGGGSSDSSSTTEANKTILSDSSPIAYSGFGTKVVKLNEGNVVVHEFQNTSFPNAGTIRVFDPITAELKNTIEGDALEDLLGSEGIIALPNGNFLIVSSLDDVGSVVDAGSVILADVDGNVIATVSGDQDEDNIGSEGVTILNNGNFLIRSRFDDVASVVDSGSVKLVNSSTGVVIATLSSDDANDNFANAGVFALSNGNFVISSTVDNIGGIDDVGSAKLVNGITGVIIASIEGDQLEDNLGSRGIAILPNGNFVISSWRDDSGLISNAGSVKLVDGTSGSLIVSIEGDNDQDYYGASTVVVLSNGNFVMSSPDDDIGGLVDAGSVKIVDGTTGVILSSIEGDQVADFLGYNGVHDGLSAGLAMGSFAVFSEFDDVGSISNAGSIKIIDKANGSVLFNIQGTQDNSRLGHGEVIVLSNKNFVVYSSNSSNGLLLNAGHVTLYDGNSGVEIASFKGDQDSDRLGSDGVYVLSNGNFVVSSSEDDVDGVVNSGSVMLIDGSSGQMISRFKGKKADDSISIGGTTVFESGDFAFVSDLEDVGSMDSAGTVRFVNGLTGKELFSEKGKTSFDFQNAQIIQISSDEYLFATPRYDLDSNINAGRVVIYKK